MPAGTGKAQSMLVWGMFLSLCLAHGFLSTLTCSDDGQTGSLGEADCPQEVILAESRGARGGHGDLR